MAVSNTRQRRSGIHPFAAFVLILVGVVGTAAILHATGTVEIDAFDRLFPGKVHAAAPVDTRPAFPVAVRALSPGQKVRREDLWDQATGVYANVRAAEDRVKAEWIRNPLEIEGRVLANDKIPGRVFTEGDFLPPGSQSGPAGLVPEGMRLLALDSSKVRGLAQLQFRNRFDLVVSEPVESKLFDQAEKVLDRQSSGQIEKRLELATLRKMAHQKVLAQNGVMIQPAKSGSGAREKEVQVAVWPEEVLPLLEALDIGRTVYAVARSGRAGADEGRASLASQEPPLERFAWVWQSVKEVEVIEGGERRTVTVPRIE